MMYVQPLVTKMRYAARSCSISGTGHWSTSRTKTKSEACSSGSVAVLGFCMGHSSCRAIGYSSSWGRLRNVWHSTCGELR